MAHIHHLSIETRIRVIKQFEKVRYQEFRELYGMGYVDNQKIIKQIYKTVKSRKLILDYFGQNYKQVIPKLIKSMVEAIFGFGSLN